VSCF